MLLSTIMVQLVMDDLWSTNAYLILAKSAVDKNDPLKYCFFFGSVIISWMSMKSSFVALVMEEGKYITAGLASWEANWLQRLLAGLSWSGVGDNHDDKLKHRKQYGFSIILQYRRWLTKPLSRAKFVYFKDKLGLVENASLIERECWWDNIVD